MLETFDETRWLPQGPELALQYRNAQPFPHICLQPFLTPSAAERAYEEFPPVDDPIWNHHRHVSCHKLATNKLSLFPKNTAQIIGELASPEFVSWLSQLVGISDLVPDPLLEGAGLHQIDTGGYLKVHADFTYHHHNNRLRRRVNLLLYLNRDWREEWGGELELWDRDVEHCVARYAPLGNHAVIFTTSETSWHGHPRPLRSPPGLGRRSIALYYYTEESEPAIQMKATKFRALPDDGTSVKILMWADQMAANAYTRAKQVFGISSDDVVTGILGTLGKFISGLARRK